MASATTEDVERLMKRCQIGTGGRNALDEAHNLLAECYGTLGALVQERDRLRSAIVKTLAENRHLADGDDCTLRRIVRALEG